MTKIKANDWRNLPLERWNVSTFHAYLIDLNEEKYGVTYVPFGQGPISRRWSTEKGQLKTALTKYGNEVIREFIADCFEGHRFNAQFPTLSFGFMYAYLRNNLERAEVTVRKRKARAEVAEKATDVDDDWF